MNICKRNIITILMLSTILVAYSCSVSFRKTEKTGSNVTGNDNNQINSRAVISSDVPLEVVGLDASIALPATGTGLGTAVTGLSAIGSGIGSTGPGVGNTTALADVGSSRTIRPANYADLSSTIKISLKYYGSDTLEDCSVNAPFSSIGCLLDTSTAIFTRQNLSDLMGNDSSADFSIKFGSTSSSDITSNAITATKHKITQISNINEGADDSIARLYKYNGDLYFNAYDHSNHTKLYKYDGSSITQISNTNTNGNDSPNFLTEYNGSLYFRASDSYGFYKLFRYDGHSINQISNMNPGDHDWPIYLTVYGNCLYFSALNNSSDFKLYKYDGASITQISNLLSGGDYVSSLTIYNGELYFSALNSDGINLYKYNQTDITQISNAGIFFNLYNLDRPNVTVLYNGALYMKAAALSSAHYKLFRYDGNTVAQISNIYTSGDDDLGSFVVYNGALYFNATNGSTRNLYKYDGSSIGKISGTSSNGDDQPEFLTVYNGELYFSAYNTSRNKKIYKYDGTSIIQISNIYPNGSDDPSFFTEYNGALYFSAYNGYGYKLYKFE